MVDAEITGELKDGGFKQPRSSEAWNAEVPPGTSAAPAGRNIEPAKTALMNDCPNAPKGLSPVLSRVPSGRTRPPSRDSRRSFSPKSIPFWVVEEARIVSAANQAAISLDNVRLQMSINGRRPRRTRIAHEA
jgi:hypothetical protein